MDTVDDSCKTVDYEKDIAPYLELVPKHIRAKIEEAFKAQEEYKKIKQEYEKGKQKDEERKQEEDLKKLRCELTRLSESLKFENFKDLFPKFLEKEGGIIISIEEKDEVYPLLIRFKLFGMDLLFDVGRQQLNQEFAQLSFSLWCKEIPNAKEIQKVKEINVEKIPKDKQILIYKTLNEIINSCVEEQENLEM